jgi:hydrogenase nickel incorporation protein HypB
MVKRTPIQGDSNLTDIRIAERLRRCFDAHDILSLGIVGGTGTGKTALLEETLSHLLPRIRATVLAADIGSDQDLSRLVGYGCEVILARVNGASCLDARAVAEHVCPTCLHGSTCMPLFDVLLVENTGTLILPEQCDFGETHRVLVSSVTDDDEEPLKYARAFSSADLVIVNKIDLLPHVGFSRDRFRRSLQRINARAEVIEISCRTGVGVDLWFQWIGEHLDSRQARERDRTLNPGDRPHPQ